jgi:hypothetical protein
LIVFRLVIFWPPFANCSVSLMREGRIPLQSGVRSVKLSTVDARVVANKPRFASLRGNIAAAIAGGFALAFAYAGHALAQATSPSGGIGAQLNTISGEAINSGGTAFGMACYLAAALCFGLGTWALWQSRQPQNRETGHVGRGLAGLVLCGLFATAGIWINKASITASGGNATISTTPQMVQFGTGG